MQEDTFHGYKLTAIEEAVRWDLFGPPRNIRWDLLGPPHNIRDRFEREGVERPDIPKWVMVAYQRMRLGEAVNHLPHRHKERTAFRQPGAKHPKKHLTTTEVNERTHHASTKRRFEHGSTSYHRRGYFDYGRTPRPTAEARAIEEELYHARELDDLAAIEEDGFEGKCKTRTSTYTTPVTQDDLEYPEAPKEAPMSESMHTLPTEELEEVGAPIARTGSIAQARPSGRISKGAPWRDDCTIKPEWMQELTTTQTLVVNPEDSALLRREPIDPTTRKATRIQPPEAHLTESVDWAIEDLIEDRDLALMGA